MVLAFVQQMFKLVILMTVIITGNLKKKKKSSDQNGKIWFLETNAILREYFRSQVCGSGDGASAHTSLWAKGTA